MSVAHSGRAFWTRNACYLECCEISELFWAIHFVDTAIYKSSCKSFPTTFTTIHRCREFFVRRPLYQNRIVRMVFSVRFIPIFWRQASWWFVIVKEAWVETQSTSSRRQNTGRTRRGQLRQGRSVVRHRALFQPHSFHRSVSSVKCCNPAAGLHSRTG
jgi:hypothetical protein